MDGVLNAGAELSNAAKGKKHQASSTRHQSILDHQALKNGMCTPSESANPMAI
jgi:hypothetical protein